MADLTLKMTEGQILQINCEKLDSPIKINIEEIYDSSGVELPYFDQSTYPASVKLSVEADNIVTSFNLLEGGK